MQAESDNATRCQWMISSPSARPQTIIYYAQLRFTHCFFVVLGSRLAGANDGYLNRAHGWPLAILVETSTSRRMPGMLTRAAYSSSISFFPLTRWRRRAQQQMIINTI